MIPRILAAVVAINVAAVSSGGLPPKPQACNHTHAASAPETVAGTCQFDQLNTSWTGRTQVVNGVTWYEMKCVQGHLTLSRTPN